MSTQRVATVDAATFADEPRHGTVKGRPLLGLILFGHGTVKGRPLLGLILFGVATVVTLDTIGQISSSGTETFSLRRVLRRARQLGGRAVPRDPQVARRAHI